MLNPEQQNSLLFNSELKKYFDHNELEMLLTHNKIITFSTSAIILKQGEQSEGIYFILDGIIEITAKILGEGTTNLGTLGPGNFLGEMSFIEKIPCPTSIIASNEVQCLLITNIYIELLSTYFPEIKYKLFNAISKEVCVRLKKVHDKITAFISNSDMATKSLFGEMIHSLTKPSQISFEEAGIDINQLQKLPLFGFFTKDEIAELLKHTVLLKAPKNCTLIHKGEKNASCYIVIYGAVQSSIEHDNKIAKLSVIGPATLFAGIACIDNSSPFTITFVTCEQAILLKLSEEDLDFLQKNTNTLWYKLFDLICLSLVALEKSIDKLEIRLNIETYNR